MWKKILIPAVTIPVVALLYYGMTRDARMIESPLPGRMSFDFSAPTLDGDTIRLSDLRGKVVVLNFWASWCIACIDEHPVFVRAEDRYPPEDFQMLGVVYQDNAQNARRWMRMRGGSWPSVLDRSSRIAIDYGVYGVPETYFIARDGRIAYKQIGPVSGPLMREWVTRLMAESETPELTGKVPEGASAGHTRQAPTSVATTPESGGERP